MANNDRNQNQGQDGRGQNQGQESNPGNFANDREKARESGREGGKN